MSKVFFTSDTHFYHDNIIKYCLRPFQDVAEMNETIIDNWNSTVNKNDSVFHLGDVCFGTPELAKIVLSRLNGNIHLIKGNHEKPALANGNAFAWIKDYYELKHEGYTICMFHYPILRWNKQTHGSWHLHGHVHANLDDKWPEKNSGRHLDVGVDSMGFTPISFEELKELMLAMPLPVFDHHGREANR